MKLFNSIERPLGMGNVYAPRKKEWIGTALAAAGGLASSLIGGNAASKAAKKAQRELEAQKAANDAWYNRIYYQDYLDTNAGQNTVRMAKDYAKQLWREARGAQAVAGGTDASTQQAKDAGNKMVGNAVANIAATDQMRKDHADAQHHADEQNYHQQKINIENQRSQAETNAGQQASNAMMNIAGALSQDVSNVKLNGGSNNSSEFKGVDVTDLETPDSNTTMYTSAATGLSGTVDDWRKAIIGK